jgi:hypothetical protein
MSRCRRCPQRVSPGNHPDVGRRRAHLPASTLGLSHVRLGQCEGARNRRSVCRADDALAPSVAPDLPREEPAEPKPDPLQSGQSVFMERAQPAQWRVTTIAVLFVAAMLAMALPAHASSSSSRQPAATFSGQGVTFDYPKTWNVRTDGGAGSMAFAFAFLSNQPQHAPCTATGSLSGTLSGRCGPAVSQLGPNGVAIVWTRFGSAVPFTVPRNAVAVSVDGKPAFSFSDREGSWGGAVGRADKSWIVLIPTSDRRGFTVSVALRGPHLKKLEQQVRAMFDSARIER